MQMILSKATVTIKTINFDNNNNKSFYIYIAMYAIKFCACDAVRSASAFAPG